MPTTRLRVTLLACLFGLVACGNEAPPSEQPSALAVAPLTVRAADSYRAVQRFSGQVEAARASALGFELGGEIARVRVDDGATVEAGQLLAELDQDRLRAALAEADAAVQQASAQAALSAATLARIERAREFDGVSQQELDEARELSQRTRAAEQAAVARRDRLRVDLAKTELRAPYAAAVIRRTADEGQVVAAGQPVLDIQELAALQVRLAVAADALDGIAVGDAVPLDVGGATIDATVKAIVARRDRRTRAVEVILTLDEGAPARVGDIAELLAERRVVADGFWLPLEALTEGARGVWEVLAIVPIDRRAGGASVTGATHRLERRPIEILYQTESDVFARGALRDGDVIVARGLQRVVPGQSVRILAPADDVDLAERDGSLPGPQS